MPLYEYQCKKCKHKFEKIQKFSDRPIKKCPECGGPLEKIQHAPNVQFKGSGWYVTDYGGKSDKSKSDGSEKGSSEKDTSDKPSSEKKESTAKEDGAKSKDKDRDSSSSKKSESKKSDSKKSKD